jgi:hypothetical protein
MRKIPTEQGTQGSVRPPAIAYGAYDMPTCVICGCTSEVPCFDDGAQPCYWVTLNKETNAGTCSACLGF